MQKRASSDDAKLSVYKASAGSGKTHRLTAEYLCLLFNFPNAYKHILAVTFTNKATDEMKNRIIKELANLALGNESDYTVLLSGKYKLTEEQVRLKAKETLIRILHDYSSFSVSTIDRFFQQTMRAFTREIGLGGGYNVELDTNKVLNEAIDSMLSDLEKSDNKQLLDWLIRFSEEKVENGETWNIRNDIQALSGEIFKESYKAFSLEVQEDIANKELMDDYKKMLHSYVQSFERKSQQIGEKAINIIDRFGLSIEDYKGGTRSPFKSFLKWATGYIVEPTASFSKLKNDISNWYTSKTDNVTKNKIEDTYNSGLNDCICEIITHYSNSSMYQTAYEINRYFFTLGILGDIDHKIREYTSENNIMLIADTTELLNQIIKGNDTPFIYERVGTHTNHYMIDEFQDTSRMQWQNFLPLVQNSLAEGSENFIVGDVKQSIYRWRNSDWKLLDEQLDIDFNAEGIKHETLDTNWRSACNIINFNNAIFVKGAKLLQDTYNKVLPENDVESYRKYASRIVKAYKEVYQHTPASKLDNQGHVKLEFIDTEEYNWQERVLELLPSQIEKLQEKGYKLKDIAILVRTKKEGADIANRLLEYKEQNPNSKYRYDIISDEALYVNNAKSIKLIIALLKYLRNPYDNSLKVLAVYEYFKYYDQLKAEDALQKYFSQKDELPEEIKLALNRIRELPLYEMTEEVFALFKNAMEIEEQIYIQSFLDMVLDFTVRYSSDLDAFLNWWDESGTKKTIFTPDEQDAIRIMTIHKSKGLGFNVVLIPFCNWEIDHKLTTILWCNPFVEPFNMLHLVPVKYSQKLKNTIFENEYFDERLHAYIDNFNILYVAFTRAKNELLIYSPLPKKDDIVNISSLLWNCVKQSHTDENIDTSAFKLKNLEQFFDEENGILDLGKDYIPLQKDERKSQYEEINIDTLSSIPFDDRLKLVLNNKYFFTDSGKREYGTLMHEIISQVNTIKDVEEAVELYYISGDITREQKKELKSLLFEYLSNETISKWYSDEYRVLNEVQILLPNGKFIRPDRVMIKDGIVIVVDYKFGEKENKKYIRQIKYYADQIRKMGYKNVEGHICYIRLGKVVSIVD